VDRARAVSHGRFAIAFTPVAKVLVVDDDADIRQLVKINLELDGHEVVVAADGAAALDQVEASPPDLVILDVTMPGVDGWEVLSRIKADRSAPHSQIPVLMLTARSDDLDSIRGAIEGAIRYITKPFSVVELREEVAKALVGEPESVKRRQAQHAALERLAHIEKGSSPSAAKRTSPRPRITRLETAAPRQGAPPARPKPLLASVAKLSAKQVELLHAVGRTPTVREAAERLEVSRSNVYASLRRIARKLGVRSVPELVSLARQGAFRAE
jgi:DNA-binding response OmpR family regulator/DNA-binding CsgD family transcriptional regulator